MGKMGRLVIALTVLSVSTLGAVAGITWEHAIREEIPATFGVPVPKPGDAASYTHTLVARTAEGFVQVGQSAPFVGFRYMQDTTVANADGEAVAVQAIETTPWGYWRVSFGGQESLAWRENMPTRAYVADHAIGHETLWRLDDPEEEDVTGTGFIVERQQFGVAFSLYTPYADVTPRGTAAACGSVHAFQGQEVSLAGSIQIIEACGPGTLPLEPEQLAGAQAPYGRQNATLQDWLTDEFTALGTQSLDETPTIVLQSARGAMLWFSAGEPFPVQMAVPASESRLHVLRLQGGSSEEPDEPLRTSDIPHGAPAPLQPWGPDDSGVVHPFPASAAWAASVDGDVVAGWLSDHPQARLYALQSSSNERDGVESVEDPELRFTWTFSMVDDEDTFAWSVTWSRPRAFLELPPAGPLAPSIEVRSSEPARDAPTGDWEQAAPTAASAIAAWRAFANDGSKYPGWSYTVRCAGGACQPRVGAGTSAVVENVDTLQNETVVQRITVAEVTGVTLASDGSLARLMRIDAGVGGSIAAGPDRSPQPPAVAEARVQPWTTPPKAALLSVAAIGAGAAVAYYLWPAFAGLFSRIQDQRVLDHPARRAVHDAVAAKPGIHHQELVRLLGKTRGGVEHHVRKLVQAGALRPVRAGGYTCYFLRGVDRRIMAAAPAVRSGTAQRVLATVQDRPGLTGGELALALDINRATVSHHLQRLGAAGLVSSRREGRAIRTWPTSLAPAVCADAAG